MIAHVVLFRPKRDLTQDDIRSFARAFQDACRGIPSVRDAKVGPILTLRAMPQHIVGDMTYNVAAYLEFDDEEGLDAYMGHPLHTELARLFWLYCESTVFADVNMVQPATTDLESIFGLKA